MLLYESMTNIQVFSDPTETFFDILTRYPAPPPPPETTPNNVYCEYLSFSIANIAKRKEADEIARLNEAMLQVIAKTDEYKKDLIAKRKKLEEMNAANGSGAE